MVLEVFFGEGHHIVIRYFLMCISMKNVLCVNKHNLSLVCQRNAIFSEIELNAPTTKVKFDHFEYKSLN